MAKQYDNLYPALIGFNNLYLAYRKAAKGTLAPALRFVASAGERGEPAAATFEFDLERNLLALFPPK